MTPKPTKTTITHAQFGSSIESAVVGMYSNHPSPGFKDKLAQASHRMELRLYCCGVDEKDYIGKNVLDAGCGTGEYACWLASRGAHVTAIDLSDGSLQEARNYAKEAGIESIRFEKRSVLRTGFPDETFDLVYCTGVLHHTPDPFGGLAELCRVLRPGGKILVSLYNSFGFFAHEVRRQVAKKLGGNDLEGRVRWGCRLFPFTARRLVKGTRHDPQAALYDYFAIPHETLHSVGEVLGWFDQLGLEFIGSFAPTHLRGYPAMFAHQGYEAAQNEFRSHVGPLLGRLGIPKNRRYGRPGPLSRLLVQLIWSLWGIGVFSMSGRKPGCLTP
jgi:SAM-dependent methyltransferase